MRTFIYNGALYDNKKLKNAFDKAKNIQGQYIIYNPGTIQ